MLCSLRRLVLALCALHAVLSAAHAQRLLLIDIDDVGYDLLAETPTPTLDYASAVGRRYTSFYAHPLCSPTRASVHVGAYPSHPDLLLGGIIPPNGSFSMPLDPLQPLARVLAASGVESAKVGKWHLSSAADRAHPLEAGFGQYAGVLNNPGGGVDPYYRFHKTINGVTLEITDRYLTTDETDDALNFVRQRTPFVSVSYHAPHTPYHVPPANLFTISPLTTDRDFARAALQACDREMGRLLREALPLGYTVIIFSDNGTAEPIGGQKGTVFEGGIRVPLFALGEGVVPGTDETRIGAVDLYDTILDHFGVAADAGNRGPHSRSFLRTLRGGTSHRRWTYSERFRNPGNDPRTGQVLMAARRTWRALEARSQR